MCAAPARPPVAPEPAPVMVLLCVVDMHHCMITTRVSFSCSCRCPCALLLLHLVLAPLLTCAADLHKCTRVKSST